MSPAPGREIDIPGLLAAARAARERAYAPYSRYGVGAAVLTHDDQVVLGCNVENASYGGTICAERVALTAAVAAGHRRFVALALVTENGGAPCGLCRQVMRELAPDLVVYIGDTSGAYETTTIGALLPRSFGPESLTE